MMKQWQRFEESGKPVGLPGQTQEWRSMHDYHVVWSREAIYDVADIADYIELRFGRERADRFNDEIDAEGEALGRDFRMYTGTGIYYRKKLILKKIFDPSIIFYFVDEAVQTVYIIRVLRHERNWQKILREGISYTFD
jgi:plasmid stabilization system protein ParE